MPHLDCGTLVDAIRRPRTTNRDLARLQRGLLRSIHVEQYRAAKPIDAPALVAIACLVVSWFQFDTLVTDLGRVEISFRFYHFGVLNSHPGLLFTGIGDGHGFATVGFALVCVAAALAPLAPLLRNSRGAWLAGVVPLLLIALFGGLLYLKISTDYFSTQAQEGSLGTQIVDLANSVTNRLLGQAAKRVHIAIGGYLGLVASAYLAVRSLRAAARFPRDNARRDLPSPM